MSQTLITAGQSLLDVAIQELGSVATLFDLADANGLAITDALAPGLVLVIPDSVTAQPDVVAYFQGRAQRLNTGDSYTPIAPRPRPRDFSALDFKTQDFS